MRRRTFVLLAGAAVPLALLWTKPAWSQTKILRVGILTVDAAKQFPLEPFYRTLRESGWVEGKNVAFEYRDAGSDPRGLAGPAAELIRLKVDVLFPIGPPAVRAAFAATRDIPIVAHDFETDPVDAGYAKSYSWPGGNLTGLFLDSPDLAGKWVEFLKAVVPKLSRAVVLFDSNSGPIPLQAVRSVAPSLGVKIQVLEIKTPQEIDQAPSAFRGRPQALIVLPSPMMYVESARLAQVAKKSRLPATSMF
ncbi:MAG: ABC transporter substrate-binding protein, partial [Gammaproteobacteria bacterium]